MPDLGSQPAVFGLSAGRLQEWSLDLLFQLSRGSPVSAVRRSLDGVRVGDQVRLAGLLVNYQMDDWQNFWRRTSTTREDDGCEVVFLKEIEVLSRGTPGWYSAYRLGWIAILLIPVLYLFLIWIEAGKADTTTLGRL